MKLTEWYSGDQKPARKGVYQRKGSFCVMFCYWDGLYWYFNGMTEERALNHYRNGEKAWLKGRHWRGVAK